MSELKHLGIIMDGNGRWASRRRRDRFWGHLKGAKVAQKIIETCAEKKLESLTLYTFSSENWKRPEKEVSFLMHLLKRQLHKERHKLIEQNIRFTTIGDSSKLPETTRKEIQKTVEMTKDNTGMNLVFALSYGGRQEITNACRALAEKVQKGEINAQDITEQTLADHLETQPHRDPDLIIRTSGEFRLSNFLLWQAAYSELIVSPTLWPDFTVNELEACFREFQQRSRRFGGVSSQNPSSQNHPEPTL